MITVLAGGVGGAKFLSGLAGVLDDRQITAIVNTGDDIRLHGLHVSPDLDTVCYALAGLSDPAQGWGVAEDRFLCLDQLGLFGEETWFRLGDRDLATHILRSKWLNEGATLSQVTCGLAARLGVRVRILPMTDAFVPTRVITGNGEMHLQEYFVREQCRPSVLGFRYTDIESCRPAPGVREAIENSDTVILAPSNPFISIGPILAVPGVREALMHVRTRVAAVSPIIAGRAVKGPAAAMLQQLGHEVSAAAVAELYVDLATLFVIDRQDEALAGRIEALRMRVLVTETWMGSPDARQALARSVLKAMGR